MNVKDAKINIAIFFYVQSISIKDFSPEIFGTPNFYGGWQNFLPA